MWAGSGISLIFLLFLIFFMDQELENRLEQDFSCRQQGENWLKCDDDDVGICYDICIKFYIHVQLTTINSFTHVHWKVSPVHEEDVLKLSGGGDWHTAYLLIYGPRFCDRVLTFKYLSLSICRKLPKERGQKSEADTTPATAGEEKMES